MYTDSYTARENKCQTYHLLFTRLEEKKTFKFQVLHKTWLLYLTPTYEQKTTIERAYKI